MYIVLILYLGNVTRHIRYRFFLFCIFPSNSLFLGLARLSQSIGRLAISITYKTKFQIAS